MDFNMNEAVPSNPTTHQDLAPTELIEMALALREGILSDTGALRVVTGARTGRSPADRFVVKEPSSEDAIDWGGVNRPFDEDRFDALFGVLPSRLGSMAPSARQYRHRHHRPHRPSSGVSG